MTTGILLQSTRLSKVAGTATCSTLSTPSTLLGTSALKTDLLTTDQLRASRRLLNGGKYFLLTLRLRSGLAGDG